MATIKVRIQPGARCNQVLRCDSDGWHIKIAAPAVDGKANKKLIDYLSQILGIPKNRIAIKKGIKGKWKVISIEGFTEEMVMRKLVPSAK